LHAREALRVKVQTLNDEAGKLPREAEMSGLENEMTDLEQRINELVLPALRDGIVFAPELVSGTLIARDELSRQLTTTQSKIEQNLQRVRELEKYLSEHAGIPSSVQSQEQLVGELDRRLRVIKRAIEGVQSTGESLRNRIRPNVQGYMSAVLPALTSSKYRAAMLDDDYNLQVWDPEAGEYRPKEVYSGGTEDQFLLAMRLSFALALLPEVKGQKPEFVFLDEPLGSSDEVRRSGIVDYLAQDLSKKFKQIFIISHVGGLEEHVQNIVSLEDGRVA
jgi:exonuclease SbcC